MRVLKERVKRRCFMRGKGKSVLFLFIVVTLFLLHNGCTSQFEVLPEAEVDPEMKATAERIGNTIFNNCKNGKFEPLGEEASEIMRTSFTPEKQKASYAQIKKALGDFNSMAYVETCVPKEGGKHYIFRFKGDFEKNKNIEVRVVMNEGGELDGFWTKPWRDKL
jgi:hypothetical protein